MPREPLCTRGVIANVYRHKHRSFVLAIKHLSVKNYSTRLHFVSPRTNWIIGPRPEWKSRDLLFRQLETFRNRTRRNARQFPDKLYQLKRICRTKLYTLTRVGTRSGCWGEEKIGDQRERSGTRAETDLTSGSEPDARERYGKRSRYLNGHPSFNWSTVTTN